MVTLAVGTIYQGIVEELTYVVSRIGFIKDLLGLMDTVSDKDAKNTGFR